MYITPDSTIYIINKVLIDNTYRDTIYFDLPNQQRDYFMGKLKYRLTDYSYQRKENTLKVGIKADNLYDCNYLMFQNTAYGSKWFYAFITRVEYINDNTSEIFFEIDVMQTYHFNYRTYPSLIIREHSATDEIGDNIADESIAYGEYMYDNYKELSTNTKDIGVVIGIADQDSGNFNGGLYENIYSGIKLYAFRRTDSEAITTFLAQYAEKPESVIMMYICPFWLIPPINNDHSISYATNSPRLLVSLDAITKQSDFDGYVPKNRKLYIYPYNMVHIDNSNGSTLELRYEFFTNLTPRLAISGIFTQPAQMVCRPYTYKGSGDKELLTESCTVESFPSCAWASDYFTAWYAQNTAPTIGKMLLSTGSVVAGGALMATGVGGVAGAGLIASGVTGFAGTLVNHLSGAYNASIQADITRGNFNSGNVNTSNLNNTFFGCRVHITREYAEMIDTFFSMYGYACNKVKQPNRNVRKQWTFCQTDNACLAPIPGNGCSCEDIAKIKEIYNKGITWWETGDNIGRYDLDNKCKKEGD